MLTLRAFMDEVFRKETSLGVASLDEPERVAFCVWIADGAVGNGGMHSVCYNSVGDYLRYFPEAFDTIGASVKAALFRKLITYFGPKGPSPVHSVRLHEHERLSDRFKHAIDSLDDDYHAAGQENIEDLLPRYLMLQGRLDG